MRFFSVLLGHGHFFQEIYHCRHGMIGFRSLDVFPRKNAHHKFAHVGPDVGACLDRAALWDASMLLNHRCGYGLS